MSKYDYDLIVLGGGAGGLTAAGIAANAGVKTMLVEKDQLGGDCTWTGCIPSKALLHYSRHVFYRRSTERAGGTTSPGVMELVRSTVRDVYRDADDPSIYESYGVVVVEGEARFTDPHTIEIDATLVGGSRRSVTGRMFVLATGASPQVPPITGIEGIHYLTNETLFELNDQPPRLAIVGGGPIGVEMAQAFNWMGSEVTLVEMGDQLLGKDDPENAAVLLDVLKSEGVQVLLGTSVEKAGQTSNPMSLFLSDGSTISADAVLLATGREVHPQGLGLEAAGVAYTERGVTVNDRCRTSQRHIFAVGDCTGEYQLTHMSEHMAKVAITNAVLKFPMKLDRLHVPWVTYTSPEVAQVGRTEKQLKEGGKHFEVYRFPFSRIDRAVTDATTAGQIKIMATRWRGKILGASIVGERAGELISYVAAAMRHGVSLKSLSDTIHPYPTYALGVRRAADQWYARRQFPWAIRLLQKVFRYRGQVPPEPDPERIV